jgi:protein SCO1/2
MQRRNAIAGFGLIAGAALVAESSAAALPDQVAGSGGGRSPAARFPNVVLRTHEDQSVRFYDDLVRGKVVLINFFFTTCTRICTRSTANLVKVADTLGDRIGRDVFMVSISVDPVADTPAAMRQYAATYKTKPGWVFVTGRQDDIDLIRRQLGMIDDGPDKTQHTGVLVYGNEPRNFWGATPILSEPRLIVRNVLKAISYGSAAPAIR